VVQLHDFHIEVGGRQPNEISSSLTQKSDTGASDDFLPIA
jgi:hypothetical protein